MKVCHQRRNGNQKWVRVSRIALAGHGLISGNFIKVSKMNPIQINATESETFTQINIEIEGGVCVPADLKTLEIPIAKGNKGVVLNGRAPIWVFATLVHHFHATQWVATNDPRLGGAVVVESHVQGVEVGDIIPLA